MSRRIRLKIYVGNLPWSIADNDLENLFASHGNVESAQVVTDKESGRSRGFGFVEMDSENGNRAISALNGQEIESRELRVNEAQAKEKRTTNF